MPLFDEKEQDRRLDFLRKQEEEELARILSAKYGVEYLDLSLVSISSDALSLIPEVEAKEAEVAAFARIGKKVKVAVRRPEEQKTKVVVSKLSDLGYDVSIAMVSEQSLKRAWERYQDLSFATESKAGVFEISSDSVSSLLEKVTSVPDISTLIKEAIAMKRTYRITRILEIILAGAFKLKASDIHLEPEESGVIRLRYRRDGVLNDILTLDHETYRLMLSRLKLLSGLKLNITSDAQDGRFSIKMKGAEIEIRTSILPGPYAESVVMRILNSASLNGEPRY